MKYIEMSRKIITVALLDFSTFTTSHIMLYAILRFSLFRTGDTLNQHLYDC
jgi:hypothetical protein